MNGGGPSEDDETQAILHTSDTGPAPRLIGVARRDQASGDVELGQIGGIEQQLEDLTFSRLHTEDREALSFLSTAFGLPKITSVVEAFS
eukprot:CAMPEP_0172792982 /NCGR_PEP_ID=MMETSP1074-20121228/209247_1 /TAXON_ID=2916 /ORGANISM="Ceratium fusus, Strain PA161109" /LENGTH=88 /DNA_ID=CAMNT_0013630051 /DNA_START=19 /DNA_END=286 /DNA_ORIENTATION=+